MNVTATCLCCLAKAPSGERLCPLCEEQFRKSAAFARVNAGYVGVDHARLQFAEAGLCRHGGEP